MMPRLGEKYAIDIEVTSKPQAEYQTDEYFELDLPVAPAVMVGEEIVMEGADVSDHEVEASICRHLGLPEPEPPKKGIMNRFFKR
ncbi:MAG: hypothetical protein R6X05_05575 [Desulfobacterales bacterium]|jgi:hypothetical protein